MSVGHGFPQRPHVAADCAVTVAQACAWQSQRCLASGSPVAAAILDVCARTSPEWTAAVGVSATVRFGDHIPLRIMAALHYLALTRQAAALAIYLPTISGTAQVTGHAFERSVVDTLLKHESTLTDFLSYPPQTNEPGRQSVLALALGACPPNTPIDLVELGCSAGINLAIDTHDIAAPPIASRRGCDLNPIDVHTVDGRARISAYVWVDDVHRFAALGRAIESAGRTSIEIVQSDAAHFVRTLQPKPGHTLLVWTSAFAPYLDEVASSRLSESIQSLVGRLPADAALALASWEDLGDTSDPKEAFGLTLTEVGSTTTGTNQVIARGSAHGAHLTQLPR